VHRSGRAARAGRIGFCWGLIDPEEMPYMIDLHLFLGRHPTNSEADDSKKISYNLNEMTPDMVHYGALPATILTQEIENVQRLIDSELTGSLESESIKSLSKVCSNAMKQYRRTRPEASRDAVRRAKEIMEGTRLESGQRVGKGKIPTHPLFRAQEEKIYLTGKADKDDNLHSLDNFKDCENLLEQISAFRPKETVFEAFATGTAKDVGVASQVDRGRTTSGKKVSSVAALTAMKNMRRQMKAIRDKGTALVVAGSNTAQKLNDGLDAKPETQGIEERDTVAISDEDRAEMQSGKTVENVNDTTDLQIRRPRKFLSKAERRRQAKAKKSPGSEPLEVTRAEPKKQKPTAADFKDPAFYIDNDLTDNKEEAMRSRQIEAAMQPTSGLKGIVRKAFRLEEAMLDVVGDENEELVQKQRMMRWDKSKRKYVKTTVGSELSGDSKSKKMRLESGQLVSSDKMKLGELYTKWQKKTNRSIGRSGVFDDAPAAEHRGRGNDTMDSKSALEIKKERAKKQNLKIKNMKKGDRRRMEQQQKQGDAKRGGNSPKGRKKRK
jgi:ATP-dependent RNA helicase DDX54/DBP10